MASAKAKNSVLGQQQKLGTKFAIVAGALWLTSCQKGYFCYSVPTMKKDIHPANFRKVIFHDNSSGTRFLIGSTIETEKTEKWEDKKEYDISYVDVSSASHPFYTGQEKVMDTAGRVERFKARASLSKKKK